MSTLDPELIEKKISGPVGVRPFKSIAEKMKELEMKIRKLQARSTHSSEGSDSESEIEKEAPREDEVSVGRDRDQEIEGRVGLLSRFGVDRESRIEKNKQGKAVESQLSSDNDNKYGVMRESRELTEKNDYKNCFTVQSERKSGGYNGTANFGLKTDIFSKNIEKLTSNNLESDYPNLYKQNETQRHSKNLPEPPKFDLQRPEDYIENEIRKSLRPKNKAQGIFEGTEESDEEPVFNHMSPKLGASDQKDELEDSETETDHFVQDKSSKVNYLKRASGKVKANTPARSHFIKRKGGNLDGMKKEEMRPAQRFQRKQNISQKPFIRKSDPPQLKATQQQNQELENQNFQLNEALQRSQAKLTRTQEANQNLTSKMSELEEKYAKLLELFEKSNKRLLHYKSQLETRKNCPTCSFRAQRKQTESRRPVMSRQTSQKRLNRVSKARRSSSRARLRESVDSFYGQKNSSSGFKSGGKGSSGKRKSESGRKRISQRKRSGSARKKNYEGSRVGRSGVSHFENNDKGKRVKASGRIGRSRSKKVLKFRREESEVHNTTGIRKKKIMRGSKKSKYKNSVR